jgi:AcrR family transcriptional regulator
VTHDPYSPRKSVRQSRARETIEAILQASAQIVTKRGISELTTNRIAEIAGVSIGSLYQYFPGKDAVVHALVEREFNRAVDAFVALIESIDPDAVPLDEAVRAIVDKVFEHQVHLRPVYKEIVLAALSFKHLRFTLQNDARVLAAVREKLVQYPEIDREHLDMGTFVALYAMKGVQLGSVFAERPPDDPKLRAIMARVVRACLVDDRNMSAPRREAKTTQEQR